VCSGQIGEYKVSALCEAIKSITMVVNSLNKLAFFLTSCAFMKIHDLDNLCRASFKVDVSAPFAPEYA